MIRSRKIKFTPVSLLACLLLLNFACERPGDEIEIPTGPVPTVEYLVEQGWESYEAGDYVSADSLFTAANLRDVLYKEAYLGFGWSLIRRSDYNNALPKFDLLLTLVSEAETEFKVLSYAGKAMSYAGLNSDSLSCIEAEYYLDLADEDYVFEHDNRVSTTNINKLLLNSYWNYQKFYGVQNTIINHFESDWFDSLVVSDDNLTELSDSSAFITVEIEVDTNVVPYDTSITMAKIELEEDDKDINLLEVIDITDSLLNIYPVKMFIHGSNVIYVDVDAMEDISMLLDDQEQEVLVDFIYTEDYGKYLNTLLEKIQSLY